MYGKAELCIKRDDRRDEGNEGAADRAFPSPSGAAMLQAGRRGDGTMPWWQPQQQQQVAGVPSNRHVYVASTRSKGDGKNISAPLVPAAAPSHGPSCPPITGPPSHSPPSSWSPPLYRWKSIGQRENSTARSAHFPEEEAPPPYSSLSHGSSGEEGAGETASVAGAGGGRMSPLECRLTAEQRVGRVAMAATLLTKQNQQRQQQQQQHQFPQKRRPSVSGTDSPLDGTEGLPAMSSGTLSHSPSHDASLPSEEKQKQQHLQQSAPSDAGEWKKGIRPFEKEDVNTAGHKLPRQLRRSGPHRDSCRSLTRRPPLFPRHVNLTFSLST